MFVLGITGPSGAGKGTACAILERFGFYHIDTDRLAPIVYPEALPALTEAFGSQIEEQGTVNRKELAKAAFATPQATARLNSIMHPLIMAEVKRLIQKAEKEGYRGVTVDGAALYEAHAETICDKMICILAPREARLERIVSRDNIGVGAANLRLNAQKQDAYYTEKADATIVNRTVEQLENDLTQQIKEWNYE